jgi:hypothetical protein
MMLWSKGRGSPYNLEISPRQIFMGCDTERGYRQGIGLGYM